MESSSASALDHLVLRVDAKDGSAEPGSFDARILFHDWHGGPPSAQNNDSAEGKPAQSYFDQPVPFETRLPNRPFTLVVRKHRGSIVSSLETRDKAGHVSGSSWGHGNTSVYVHLPRGVTSAYLPDSAQEASDWNGG